MHCTPCPSARLGIARTRASNGEGNRPVCTSDCRERGRWGKPRCSGGTPAPLSARGATPISKAKQHCVAAPQTLWWFRLLSLFVVVARAHDAVHKRWPHCLGEASGIFSTRNSNEQLLTNLKNGPSQGGLRHLMPDLSTPLPTGVGDNWFAYAD